MIIELTFKRSPPRGRSFFLFMELIVLALLILVGLREYLAYRERSQMLDRLMAKNLTDYKDTTQTPELNQLESDDDDTMPIEDAEEAIVFGKEINGEAN